MEQFVSESIVPGPAGFDAAAMARGEPGLPAEFKWRGRCYRISAKLGQWKQSSAEGGRVGGERYLRRHYYKLRMSDESTWTVYFVRQSPPSGPAKQRWFLYKIDQESSGVDDSA